MAGKRSQRQLPVVTLNTSFSRSQFIVAPDSIGKNGVHDQLHRVIHQNWNHAVAKTDRSRKADDQRLLAASEPDGDFDQAEATLTDLRSKSLAKIQKQ